MRTGMACAVVLTMLVTGVCAAQETDWQAEMDRKMSAPLSVRFDGTELTEALQYFRQRMGVNVILDRGADTAPMPRVTLSLTDVQGESALAWTVRLAGLTYVVKDQAVYVTRENNVDPAWRQSMQRRYLRRLGDENQGWMRQVNLRLAAKIDVNFIGEPVDRVMQTLAQEGGLNIVVDPVAANAAPPIRFEARQMTIENIISWATRMANLKSVIQDEVIYVSSSAGLTALRLETGTSVVPPRFHVPVTFKFDNTEMLRALRHLQQLTDVLIEVKNPPAVEQFVTLSGNKMDLDLAVRQVLDRTGLPYAISYREDAMVVVFAPPAPEPKPKATP